MSKVTSIPQLRFPEFSGEWKEKKLSDVAEIVGGGTPPTAVEKYWGGDIQWFTPTEIKNKYIVNSKRTITQVGLDTSSARLLPKGTLLFSSRATVGEIGIAVQECTTNQGFQSFIVNKDNDSEFLYNWIIKNKKEFIRRASGSTFLEIGKSEIKKIKSNIPLLSEQQKIAAFLTAVDNKIEQLIKKQELLGEYKKGLMQQIFSQAIRFKADDGGDYPDWEELKLGEVARFRRGSFPQPYGNPEWYDDEDGKPFVQVYDVAGNMRLKSTTKRKISVLAQSSSVFVPKGNVVLTIQGSIGRIALTQYDAYVDRTLLIFTGYIKEVNKQFFIYVIYLLFEIEKIKAPGGTIKTITKEALTSFKLDLPCFDEQTKIANFLSSIDSKIEQVGKQLDKSKQFKKALLQQMFV